MLAAGEGSAVRFWSFFCAEAETVVADIGEVLGEHLREAPLGIRKVSRERSHGTLELQVGRMWLRIECPLICLAPTSRERRLAEMFGEDTPLVRAYVLRNDRPIDSWIAADPVAGFWASSEPELGPVPFSDRAALETFLCSLLIDRRG